MINKVAYDYENVRISAGSLSVDLGGMKKIAYASKVESEKIFGSARDAIDATDGVENVDDQDWEMQFFQWQNLKEALGGAGFMRKKARFDTAVSYAHEGEDIVTDTLQRVRIIGVQNDHAQGAGGLAVTVTVQIMKILYGGDDPMAGDN
jgi:hypothetical protein